MELSSKNSINHDKSLCLYCDKAFSNNVDQENHVERDHKTILCKGKGSRKSERITKNNSSPENSPFPGCFQCNKRISRTDDLDTLFQHLLAAHRDVYFGCKCKIRTQDKASLVNHKKNCKIGGGGKSARCSEENLTDNRKSTKKSPTIKINGDSKCDSLSDSDGNVSAAAAKPLPTNAMHKKSDRNKLRNLSKSASVNDKGKKNKLSSSSSTTSSSSSNKTGEDEYTIPLTRQKLKEPPTFARLGATQNRSSGNKKSQKTNKNAPANDIKNVISASPATKVHRTKTSKVVSANSHNNPEPIEVVPKNESVYTEFDEDFYKNISHNIRLNLDCYVDGKSHQLQNRPVFDLIAEQPTDTPAASSDHEKEIHEATAFELSTPFPALLTVEQYGFGDSNPNKPKRQITKNSWKWKWDLIKKYKYVNEGGKIVKKVKQITTGLKDLSQLDMWTQLSMRSRYENLNSQNDLPSELDDGFKESLSTRMIRTQNIEQLNSILDKRLTPEINIEQLEQTVIKMEPEEREETCENYEMNGEEPAEEVLNTLNLLKTDNTRPINPVLSGEWARPRCYICIDCGMKFDLMKSLNEHKNSEHPYVVAAHYEIVGRENLEQKLYKNLFLPKKALQANGFARSLSINSDSKSNETNEASTSSDYSSKFFADQKEMECSKCLKMIKYSSDNDIHRHILDCIEDRAWMQAKRRSKYRRSRRKGRKTTRKSRLSFDMKKAISSPSTKDNTEGENSIISISNPPTPKNDVKFAVPIDDVKLSTPQPTKPNKPESLATEKPVVNGKVSDGMNIKNFFRVSKTTPALPQKVVVHMLEMPSNNQNNSLRSSLRSSSAKRSLNNEFISKNSKTDVVAKENVGQEKPVESSDDSVKTEVKCDEENNSKNSVPKVCGNDEESIDAKCPLTPLTITTPEKAISDFPLSSPSNLSLISPTSNSNVPKKKKKLNDCIAMLTCKIQEKLGVNFFNNSAPEVASSEGPCTSNKKPCESIPTPVESTDKLVCMSPEKPTRVSPLTLPLPKERKPESKPSTSFQIESILNENEFSLPIQDEVIDLSIKKKPSVIEEPKVEKPIVENFCEEVVISLVVPEVKVGEIEVEMKPTGISLNVEAQQVEPENVIRLEKPQVKSHNDLKVESLPEPVGVETENIVTKTNEQAASLEKPLVETFESLKISIPKSRIPNLQKILDQYQVITVNNIKISESERRAFEEQKNRILQILNKTNNLKRKITSKKAVTRKAGKRKAPARKASARRNAVKKSEVVKSKPEASDQPAVDSEAEKVEAKIEEVIKSTNRIRCRRLSVVVDPIINLAAFQNKNRKIRLTNNSQQNGFYELLAASEQFFSNRLNIEKEKSETVEEKPKAIDEVKPEAVKIPSPEIEVHLEKMEMFEMKPAAKTRAAKTAPVEPIKSSSDVDNKKAEPKLPTRNRAKVGNKKPEIILAEVTPEVFPEEIGEENPSEIENAPKVSKVQAKKTRGKKQNVENVKKPAAVEMPSADVEAETDKKTENEISNQPVKSTLVQRKANAKNSNQKVFPLEEIKVGQSVKANAKAQPERRKKVLRGKQQQQQEENLLDISFSSDTSNENDIPLAKLVPPGREMKAESSAVQEPVNIEAADDTKVDLQSVKDVSEKLDEEVIKAEADFIEKKPEIIESPEDKTLTMQPFLNKTSSTFDLSEIKEKKNFDPFTINEDSFFNDDLDNDPSDKINDIVNNIINSSEFQIDSDTEKSEVYQADGHATAKNQLSSCVICKRTFRSEKGYEKHCTTSTHIMKVQRKNRGIAKTKERESIPPEPEILVREKSPSVEKAPSPILDETKVFRTKGALKTFDTVPIALETEKPKLVEEVMQSGDLFEHPKLDISLEQNLLNANDDKLYYEFKMEKKPEDMTPKDKDQLFDSLFNSLEAKAEEKRMSFEQKFNFSTATPQDSEMESSSTSWDLKHDGDIEWEADNTDNVSFAMAIKERYPKKFPVKINKLKDTAVSIPTKSLIMGKIFKKHRDSEKQKTPQADAPNNKPGIKNSLDEIFDHLKNSAEIDDKVLTCPSPKTLLKSAGGMFSPNSSNSKDMLETASHSNNNNIYAKKTVRTSPEQDEKKPSVNIFADVLQLNDSTNEDGDDGIGKRKSRRRCAIKAKTFAETWSSDEYEELHDTADIISIINEIEKRDSIKKRKLLKAENLLELKRKHDSTTVDHPVKSDAVKPTSIMRSSESLSEKKFVQITENLPREKVEKKKSVQIQFADEILRPEKPPNSIKKRRMSTAQDGHKSDEETFTATKDFKPAKPGPSIKKRRMSCFVPSTTSFDDRPKPKPPVAKPIRIETEILKKFEKANENHELKKSTVVKKADSEKSFKNQKKFANLLSHFGGQQSGKKKAQKHRKRPRNKVKNIAYDSDSDFELNLSRKSKAPTAAAFSEISSSEDDEDEDNDDVVIAPKPTKSQTIINSSRSSNTNDMTMIKESKLLPNDLKHVVPTTTFNAAIPEDIIDTSQNACNRTKRQSSEKLYYWSSSSSESDQEQGDTADGDNEDSVLPHQPEQHGWIVGASHKKLVTLLAHAKIKNKIN